MQEWKIGAAAALSCFWLAGCGANGDPNEAPSSESEQALGEMGCATLGGYPYSGSPTLGTTQPAPPWTCGQLDINWALSPDRIYLTRDCLGYVLEVQNTGPRATYPFPLWVDPLNDEWACPDLRLDLALYQRSGSDWSLSGTATYHGVWNGWECLLELDAGQSTPVAWTWDASDAVRVAGFAHYGGLPREVGLFLIHVPIC
jgi:hypothetical protein